MNKKKTERRREHPADWRLATIDDVPVEEFAGFGDRGEYPEWQPNELSGAGIEEDTRRPD